MLERIRSIRRARKIPGELRADFSRYLIFTNIKRCRIIVLALIPIFAILVVLDLLNWKNGLWTLAAYRVLFYVHLITGILLIMTSIALSLKPIRTAGDIGMRHRAMFLFIISFIVLTQLVTTFADIRIKGQITVYIMIAVIIAAVTVLRLVESVIIYAVLLALFIAGLGYVVEDPMHLYGHVLNGSIMTVVAWVMSRIVYVGFSANYLYKKEIERQNENIIAMADKMRHSEMEYRQLFENSPIGVFRTAADGTVIAANRAMMRTLGFNSIDELNAMGILNLYVDQGDRARIWEKVREGAVSGFETVFRRADGTAIPVSIGGSLMLDDAGNPAFLEGTIEDITERKKIERSLQESEEKFRTMVDAIPHLVTIWNMDIKCRYVSPSSARILGYTPDEFLALDLKQFLPPESIEIVLNAYKAALERERTRGPSRNSIDVIEMKEYHKNGSIVLVENTITFMRDAEGNPVGIIILTADIAERKRAEKQKEEAAKALRRSEERYRLVAENSDDLIFILDPDLKFTYMSPASLKLLGKPADKHMQEPINEIMTPESFTRIMSEYRRQLPEIERGGNPTLRMEIEEYRKDGSTVWVEVNIRTMRDDTGRLNGYVGVTRDISERKRAEQELRESEEKYKFLVENTTDVIWIFDLDSMTYTYASSSLERILGYSADEAVGMTLYNSFDPETRKKVEDGFARIVMGKEPTDRILIEAEHIAKNGNRVWMEVNAVLKRNEIGKPIAFSGVSRDITERKRAEKDLHAMNVRLQASEMEYRHLFVHSPIGIFRTDLLGKVLAANPAALKMLKFSDLDAINAAGLLNLYVYPSDRDRLLSMVRQGIVSSYETVLRRNDGQHIFLSVSAFLELDEEGNPLYLEGSIEDITERKRAVEELKLRNILLSTEQEVSIDGILVVDENGTMISFNRRFGEIWEIPADVLASRSDERALQSILANLVDPDEFLAKVRYLYKNRTETSRDEISLRDGRTLDRYSAPMTGDDGKYYGRIWYFRDITKRKLSEKALRESERRLADIINFLPIATFVIDREGRITAWNRALEKMTGVTAADMIGKGDYEYSLPFYAKRQPILVNRVFSSEEEMRTKYSHIRCEGGILEAESYIPKLEIILQGFASALYGSDGSIIGAIESIRDITDIRRVEAELKEAEEKYRTILETMDSGYYEVDLRGDMIYCNPSLMKFLGYGEGDVKGINFRDYIDEEESGRIYGIFHDVYTTGIPHGDFYWRLANRDRRNVYTAASVYPIRDSRGAIVGFRGTVRDITALKEAQEAAEAASRSKGAFLASMSHEIRTPMNAILGFTQLMLRDQNLTSQLREHLTVINRSGEHLLSLINDILEMSKIEAGRSTLVPKTFDLYALIGDLELMFRIRTDEKRLSMLVERTDDVPRWVNTDESKLRQVLINLVGNAVKFTEEGGIALRIGARHDRDLHRELRFEVEDTGPGIDEEEIGRLFKAFEQTSAGIRSGGTGLGLALSRGFVQIMGGTLTASSAIGKGSIFRFSVPFSEGREDEMERREPGRRVLRLKSDREVRVLIADDRETNRQLLSQMLARVGFTTREVINGEEAIAMWREWKPQVILMDMTMPVMDGYEATRLIKASPGGKKIVIIAVTASAFEEDRQQVLASGADGYLAKPFKEMELLDLIRNLAGAEYLYEDIVEAGETLSDGFSGKTREAVSALPADLKRKLRDATMSADIDLINKLLDKALHDNPSAVRLMREMAAQYRYDELLDILS